ncbi:MAG: hypothetical protein U5R06_21025 [candidate division KSB1 bacterium]|nr:hypothetical protein [candidate division KSB1 bacterium]
MHHQTAGRVRMRVGKVRDAEQGPDDDEQLQNGDCLFAVVSQMNSLKKIEKI